MPKVSIVVPCWGVERYLDRCVESLVNQTLKDIEIILVDDESPDRVPEMCDEWAKRDSRIKVIHKKNGGLGMACNSGLDVATGEYVAFCDSDDWVDSKMYEVMYDTAIKNDSDAVFTGIKDVTMDGSPIRNRLRFCKTRIIDSSMMKDVLLDFIAPKPDVNYERAYEASAKVVLYRKQLLEYNRIRFVSEREIASEDQIFNICVLASSTKVCFLPKSFYNYRVNQYSITHSVNQRKWDAIKGMYNHLLIICKSFEIKDDYKQRCQRVFLGSVRVLIVQILNSDMATEEKNRFVGAIWNDAVCREVLNEYPISYMHLPQRLFTICLKHKLMMGLKIYSYFKR